MIAKTRHALSSRFNKNLDFGHSLDTRTLLKSEIWIHHLPALALPSPSNRRGWHPIPLHHACTSTISLKAIVAAETNANPRHSQQSWTEVTTSRCVAGRCYQQPLSEILSCCTPSFVINVNFVYCYRPLQGA